MLNVCWENNLEKVDLTVQAVRLPVVSGEKLLGTGEQCWVVRWSLCSPSLYIHTWSESVKQTSGPKRPVDNSVITKDLMHFIADLEY